MSCPVLGFSRRETDYFATISVYFRCSKNRPPAPALQHSRVFLVQLIKSSMEAAMEPSSSAAAAGGASLDLAVDPTLTLTSTCHPAALQQYLLNRTSRCQQFCLALAGYSTANPLTSRPVGHARRCRAAAHKGHFRVRHFGGPSFSPLSESACLARQLQWCGLSPAC